MSLKLNGCLLLTGNVLLDMIKKAIMNGCLVMQIQKDEIRNKINEAALEEFLVAGYSQSSMRNIAAAAGITVGNIYSYFSSKEHLFESLLADTLDELHHLISIEVSGDDPVSSYNIEQLTHAIADVFMKDRIQFLILMDGSGGSKYENIKTQLIELACGRIHQELVLRLHFACVDPMLSYALAIAVIEGLIAIFKKCGDDYERLKILLSEFLIVIFGNFKNRL